MQIAMVHSESDKAPTTGQALYIVVEQSKHRVVLFHPPTLSKFEIPAIDFTTGFRGELWPNPTVNIPPGKRPINEGVAAILTLKAKEFVERQRQFPASLVRLCIAKLQGIKVDDVPEIREVRTTAGPRGFAVRSAAKPGVVDAIEALLRAEKGITLDEAVKSLKQQFPDRNADGMRTTVRCQLNRIPKKLNLPLIVKDVPKRGKVFKLNA